MQLKARAVGLGAEDYLNDKATEEPDEQSYRRIPVSSMIFRGLLLRVNLSYPKKWRKTWCLMSMFCCSRRRAKRCQPACIVKRSFESFQFLIC